MKKILTIISFLILLQLSCFSQNPLVFTVTRIEDDVNIPHTLRWAISEANKYPQDHKVIEFNIPNATLPIEINVGGSPLTILVSGVFIDGNSQPSGTYTGIEPKIKLRGNNNTSGIEININSSRNSFLYDAEVKNITFSNFLYGILVNYSRLVRISECVFINNAEGIHGVGISASIMENNHIGLTRSLEMYGNKGNGISLYEDPRSFNNLIINNIISNNGKYGIHLNGLNVVDNKVSKNIIYDNFDKAIKLDQAANHSVPAPVINSINNNIVSGEMAILNDTIEVFGSNGYRNANEYLGFTVANSSGNWTFNLPNGIQWDYISATTSRDINAYINTSELCSSYPIMQFTTLASHYCESNPPVELVASPPGGVFSGPGVVNNIFYPSMIDPSSPQDVIITYQITINGNNYTASATTTVYPSEFEFSHVTPSCNPGGDGNISFIVNEGSGNYSYQWSTDNGSIPSGQADDPMINPVPEGEYNIVFTDNGYGCLPQYRSYSLKSPIVYVTVENLFICDNTSTSVRAHCARNIDPPFASPPYTFLYQWYRIQSDNTPVLVYQGMDREYSEHSLVSGKYKLVVTDQIFFCTGEVYFEVIALNTSVSISKIKDVTCYGLDNGEATVLVSGGIPPYVYQWYKSGYSGDVLVYEGSSTAQNLAPGNYYVVVTNENGQGCVLRSDLFSIQEPDELRITEPISVSDCRAIVNIEGGTPDYEYSWYKNDPLEPGGWDLNWVFIGNISTESREIVIDNLGVGGYKVVVNDANNCGPVEAIFTVEQIGIEKKYEICFRFRGEWEPPVDVPPLPPVFVLNPYVSDIIQSVSSKSVQCISQANAEMANEFNNHCSKPESIDDELTITYPQNLYQYTLYYYDRGGNLVRTVPPKGVDCSATGRNTVPNHTMVSEYDYNNINQVIRQKSPDGGESRFIYDPLGRLRFSQNAKQAAETGLVFSYTKYDRLSRVTEVGECHQAGGNTWSDLETYSTEADFPDVGTSQEVWTEYSKPGIYTYYGKEQRFIENRVSYTHTADDVYTYYSYDPHGNVEWLIQVLPGFRANHIGYEYDLISNKVTMVKYNERDVADRLFHRYTYDEDNRITGVETSRDGYLWESDAQYDYFAYGPLKSLALGQDKLQKIDYAYTINGWLKGINHPNEIGAPNINWEGYSPDIYGTSLQYFSKVSSDPNDHGDYLTSSGSYNFENDHAYNASKRLYNGNIVSWTGKFDLSSISLLANFEDGDYKTGSTYTYDKLNRLKASDYSYFTGTWSISDKYKSTFNYDANGNITHLSRYASNDLTKMDDLTYTYGNTNNNQLTQVQELLGSNGVNGLKNDIDGLNEYTYDQIGNLTSDLSSVGSNDITSIEWNAFGKISKVIHEPASALPDIEYLYDAAGNRVIKKLTYDNPPSIVRDFYVRDASGNVMTIYSNVYDPTAIERHFIVEEQPLYGSSRLGTLSTGKHVILGGVGNIESIPGGPYYRQIGQKNYEICDHLGNVRATLKDYLGMNNMAQIISVSDYYAFGLEIPGRVFNPINRFGFNGKEIDKEIFGWQDFGHREYNREINRFLSVDPLVGKFAGISPYVFCADNPILFLDDDGKEPITAIIDAITAFAVEAGISYVENIVLNDMDPQKAFDNIRWGDACVEAAKSYGLSLFITGVGSTKALAKAANSKLGKVTMEFTANMAGELMKKYNKGDFNDENGNFDFDKLMNTDFTGLMEGALIEALVAQGFSKKADELSTKFNKAQSNLSKQESKLNESLNKGASEKTIANRAAKVDKAQKEVVNIMAKTAAVSSEKEAIGKGLSKSNEERRKEK